MLEVYISNVPHKGWTEEQYRQWIYLQIPKYINPYKHCHVEMSSLNFSEKVFQNIACIVAEDEIYNIFDIHDIKQYLFNKCTSEEIFFVTRMLNAFTRKKRLYPEVLMNVIDELENHAHALRLQETTKTTATTPDPPTPKKRQSKMKKKTERNPKLTRATFKYRHLQAARHRIGTLCQHLVKYKLIDKDTQDKDFYELFEGNESDVKIKWTGTLQHLWYLFELIISREYVIRPKNGYKWVIVRSHFVDENSRMFSDFNKQHKPKRELQSIEFLANILDISKPLDRLNEWTEKDE